MESTRVTAGRTGDTEHVESPSSAVVRAVARAAGVDETDLPPLFDAVDPDALDALFRTGSGGHRAEAVGTISFEYHDHDVRVDADGSVTVVGRAEP